MKETTKMRKITTPTQTLMLTPELRQQLKNPLGQLITGSPKETMTKLKQLIKEEKPAKIISVGDVVSKNMTGHHIPIHTIIVDNRVSRKTIKPIKVKAKRTLHIKNPPGTLTPETWTTIQEALKQDQPTRVLVNGEEDLLTLVAVSQAPENALVVYGQPNQGVVAVKVTEDMKRKVQLIIDDMEPVVEKSK
jgi:hypothetical protein